LLVVGLRLLVAAAASRHSGDPMRLRLDGLLVGSRGGLDLFGGGEHEIARLSVRGRLRRRLGGFGRKGLSAHRGECGNQDEAGMHDRLLDRDAEKNRPDMLSAFLRWMVNAR
jgi:hypothetical protein